MPLRNFDRMRHGMFSRVISSGVVREPKWRARINNGFVSWAMRQPVVQSEISNKICFERPEQNPRTQKYWEHTYGLMQAPAGTVPWIVELARVTIPEASVAVCKSFEQVVTHIGLESPQYFSASANWGNPFPFPSTLSIRWFFRLERVSGLEPAQINASAVNAEQLLPGEPHFDVSEMRDLWFPAASSSSQNIHLTIGGRYRLRVLAIVERTEEYAVFISAKVRGFRVSSFDGFTVLPIRSIW